MGTFGARQRRFFQTSLLGLIFLVGLSAAAFWSWRQYTNSNRPETATDLIRLLDTGRLEERRDAARRLVMAATSESESVIAALLLSLEDPSWEVRADAVGSLGAYLATAISNRGQALLNSSRGVANLERVGEGLLDSLTDDDDAEVRVSAASALSLIRNKLDSVTGSGTTSSQPASLAHGTLVAALDAALQRDPANRRGLMLSLGMVGHRSLAAPPGLLAVLDHPDAASRAEAVMALSSFGSGIDSALTVLLRDLEDKQSVFRNENEDDQGSNRFFTSRNYWLGIRKMHLSPEVVPRLQEALGSRDPLVARCAVILLGNIGPQARAALPALVQALEKAGPVESIDNLTGNSATLAVAETIARVARPDEAVAALTKALRSPISSTREAAGTAFAGLGAKAHAAIPVLAAMLREVAASRDKSNTGGIIAHALAEVAIGAPEQRRTDPQAISALGDALGSENRMTSFTAVYALRRFGPRAAGAIPALRALTSKAVGDPEHSTVEIRRAVDFALERIEGEHPPQKQINR
jgi:HEAT repeat protein